MGGVLLLEHAGDHIVPNYPHMTSLVNAVIGGHFSLYDTGDELDDGETLSPNAIKLNGRVGNPLTGLPFIEPKINKNDWKAVEIAALSLFDIMQNLTSDLWHKLSKKKRTPSWLGK